MTLNGFLLDIHLTTESNLEVEIDASSMPWAEYNKLVEELEDTLAEIDRKYSIRAPLTRGRGLKARYHRVTAEERSRKVIFSPFPSKFTNILKNLRAYIYALVYHNCIIIEKVGPRNLYMLPKNLAPGFLEVIDKINSETLAKLKKELEEFRDTHDYFSFKMILNKYGLDPRVLDDKVFFIGSFSANIIPIDFSYVVDRDDLYKSEEYRKASRSLDLIRKSVEEKRKQYITSATKDVISKLVDLSEGRWGKGKKKMTMLDKVDKLDKICQSIGLTEINNNIVKPLRMIFMADSDKRQELTHQLFGTDNLKEGIKSKLDEYLPLLEG